MTQEEVLKKWLEITVERLRKAAPVDTKDLYNSILGNSGGTKALLSFYVRGKFTDMNVSKGRKLTDSSRLSGKKGRAAKGWYSKRMRKEMFKLSLALSNNSGKILMASINNILPYKLEL